MTNKPALYWKHNIVPLLCERLCELSVSPSLIQAHFPLWHFFPSASPPPPGSSISSALPTRRCWSPLHSWSRCSSRGWVCRCSHIRTPPSHWQHRTMKLSSDCKTFCAKAHQRASNILFFASITRYHSNESVNVYLIMQLYCKMSTL